MLLEFGVQAAFSYIHFLLLFNVAAMTTDGLGGSFQMSSVSLKQSLTLDNGLALPKFLKVMWLPLSYQFHLLLIFDVPG